MSMMNDKQLYISIRQRMRDDAGTDMYPESVCTNPSPGIRESRLIPPEIRSHSIPVMHFRNLDNMFRNRFL